MTSHSTCDRKSGDGEPVKLKREPVTKATCFADEGVESSKPVTYIVRPILGNKEGDADAAETLPASAPARQYIAIPLKTLPNHTPGDPSIGATFH
jgi:hypothetical protein